MSKDLYLELNMLGTTEYVNVRHIVSFYSDPDDDMDVRTIIEVRGGKTYEVDMGLQEFLSVMHGKIDILPMPNFRGGE